MRIASPGWAGVLGCSLTLVGSAQTAHQCVVVYDAQAKTTWRSTFKIPHALVALETGVVTPATVEKWDGTRYADQPLWNRDHTVLSALKPSVLWFFQRIAPRIGANRMKPWLDKHRYGNADLSGDITRYWVNGTLRISPDEQVDFLRQFYARELPVNQEHVRLIEDALVQTPGTVQNARGVHRLTLSWPAGVVLSSKTGATTIASRESVSWLVGVLTVRDARYVFASAVWREDGVNQLDAARLAIKIFNERGLCRCPLR